MQSDDVIEALKELSNPTYLDGMKRFGIDNTTALGVKIPEIRQIAKHIKKDHDLALQLWETGIHEARILATMIAEPTKVTPKLMDAWVNDFYSWDICDQACGNLFDKTPFWIDKAFEYSKSEHEFVKRAGFVLIAEAAVHYKKASNEIFIKFLPVIEREAWDERNFVKKAANWALRQIGKRNQVLHEKTISCAENILKQESKPAKWIATDALRELHSKAEKFRSQYYATF